MMMPIQIHSFVFPSLRFVLCSLRAKRFVFAAKNIDSNCNHNNNKNEQQKKKKMNDRLGYGHASHRTLLHIIHMDLTYNMYI